MKLIIDIDEETYKMCRQLLGDADEIERAIADGRPYEERPQGEWIEHSTYKNVLICSNCNHGSNQVYDTFNFCPNCGARMEAENVSSCDTV